MPQDFTVSLYTTRYIKVDIYSYSRVLSYYLFFGSTRTFKE